MTTGSVANFSNQKLVYTKPLLNTTAAPASSHFTTQQPIVLPYICCDVLDIFVELKSHEKWMHEGRKEQQIPELKNSSKYIC
jgi:hypothetical protein